MKNIIFITMIAVLGLTACDQKSKNVEIKNDVQKTQDIVVGDKIIASNMMQNKNLRILAENTNLSKDNTYYYQLTLENQGNQPINIRSDQIKLVDSKGAEHKVGLIDRELTEPLDPKKKIVGIVTFENVKIGTPKFIKLVD